jgi:hypothetical protein
LKKEQIVRLTSGLTSPEKGRLATKHYEAVLELLFKSDSIMQNSVIRQIKLCRNEDTIKQNNRLDAINKWLNSLNKIGCHRTLNIRK